MKNKNFSIRLNIFISMISLTLVMIAILWSLQSLFFSKLYKATKENDIQIASNLIADSIGDSNIGSTVTQVVDQYDLCIQVYRCKDAGVLFSPGCKSNGCIIHGLSDEEDKYYHWLNGANDSENGIFSEVSRSSGADFLVLSRVLTDTKGEVYLLVLNASIEPMQATVNAVKIMIALISILFLVCATLISLILSKKLSSPIIKMNNNARKLARANYDVKFDIEGPIEIRELAKTLNLTTKELGKLDSMQKELIANISHDLRTPLTMISGYAEVMRDIPDENTPENLQVIVDESARLTSLVNDLLNVSKLQAGTQVMNIQRMNLTKAVSQTVDRYARFKEHNDFNIIFEFDRQVFINADEIRLLQVIYNLINNAINYTGAQPQELIFILLHSGFLIKIFNDKAFVLRVKLRRD